MLKIQEIRELIKLIDNSSINEFVYENDGSKIEMKKKTQNESIVNQAQPSIQPMLQAVQHTQSLPVQAAPAALPKAEETVREVVQEAPAADAGYHKIVSPMVGTFYESPSPEADVYVKPGSKVSKDSVVCIVEAMKLFNEIEAEINGEIVEILVKDGQLVEYGQPLFLVKPE